MLVKVLEEPNTTFLMSVSGNTILCQDTVPYVRTQYHVSGGSTICQDTVPFVRIQSRMSGYSTTFQFQEMSGHSEKVRVETGTSIMTLGNYKDVYCITFKIKRLYLQIKVKLRSVFQSTPYCQNPNLNTTQHNGWV